MYAANFDLALYARRIGLDHTPVATAFDAAALQSMMQAQLRSITFENLDVQAGKIVSLVPEEIVSKIVGPTGEAKRGGYCYELNGLFAMALTALQIPYFFVACRPMFYPMRRPKTHMALVVTIGTEHFLCDLGFGSYGMRAPLALSQVNLPQQQDFDQFRLTMPTPGDYVLQAQIDGNWVSQFGFDLHPAEWIDFMPANYLNSTHPDTVFVQKLLLIRQHAQGRTMLVGRELKQSIAGVTQSREISEAELPELLLNHFGLVS
ncbi:arylamine N-acetyltransferase [Rheinheimera texasensis]|uniref:arylamine N-acetyltransferase family protein n=1 Tax=Rheinheimera texasensis TaxID=306205 RepID=UPI0032B18F23